MGSRGYLLSVLPVTPGQSYTVAGGSAGTTGSDNHTAMPVGSGGTGGDTSFGSLATAPGGVGGAPGIDEASSCWSYAHRDGSPGAGGFCQRRDRNSAHGQLGSGSHGRSGRHRVGAAGRGRTARHRRNMEQDAIRLRVDRY